MYRSKFFIFSVALVFSLAFLLSGDLRGEASSLPPWPAIYSGSITVDGQPAADGAILTAKIGDSYTSVPVTVSGGRYVGLAVGGPNSSYLNQVITFHLDDIVTANETDVFLFYQQPELKSPFDLTFAAYPLPTPSPTATPTNTPVATATPDVPAAMLISGVLLVDGVEASDFEGKEVVARVGSFFSDPVQIEVNYGILVFDGLALNPMDHKFVGESISFLVDGVGADVAEPVIFTSDRSVDLILTVQGREPDSLPVPTQGAALAEPTRTPVPVLPTSVAATAVPPTAVPPTAVPAASAPVVVEVVVTATPEASEDLLVEEDSGGSCNMPGKVSGATGAVNGLMLFSPLLFLAGYKGFKGRNRKR